jgi:hypothetical protein
LRRGQDPVAIGSEAAKKKKKKKEMAKTQFRRHSCALCMPSTQLLILGCQISLAVPLLGQEIRTIDGHHVICYIPVIAAAPMP